MPNKYQSGILLSIGKYHRGFGRESPHSAIIFGMQYVANQIRIRREAKGWKQHELAAAIRTQQPQINRWENGERTPDVAWIMKLAKALDCHPGALLAPMPDGTVSDDEVSLIMEIVQAFGQEVEARKRAFEGLAQMARSVTGAGGTPLQQGTQELAARHLKTSERAEAPAEHLPD